MKVAVITRHAISNYGSLLQTMATQKAIENLGHSCEIIDYVREDESCEKQELTLLKQKPNWYNNFIKRILYLALRQPGSIISGKKFEKNRRKYLKLSKRFVSLEQLINDKPEADVYLTGSDQVWGPVSNGTYDSAYCLAFTEEEDKRVSYAASFGRMKMTHQIEMYLKKWISRYSKVAVREESAVEMLKELGILSEQVLDPTLLLSSDEWESYVAPAPKGQYILVYQLHNDKTLGEYASKVASVNKLPLIRVSASLHQFIRNGKFVYLPKIECFLSYIKNAACIITDSFHGTAFAINFNTPFVEVLPKNGTSTRNMSILQLTGLEHRILKNVDDVELANESVDFSYANAVIKEQRNASLSILRKYIEE